MTEKKAPKRPKLADPLGGRSIPEWIGKTPDSKVPDEVKARVFLRYEGRCYLSRIKILQQPWQIEHIKALSFGGENRETNLAPALVAPHKEKSRQESDWRAKADRQRRNHLGLKPKATGNSKIQGRGFPKRGDR